MSRPNIVFIFTDQHHHGVMGNAGDKWVRTPNLDKLAKEGTRFANTYTNCPVCAPARMSLLSGQLPLDHGCLVNQATLDSNIPTFAHSMNIGGYQTVLAGRMHIHGADQYRGHELRLTGDNTPLYVGYNNLFPNLGKDYMFTILQKRDGIDKSGPGNSIVQEFDNSVTEDAIEFLETREDDRPLMMTIGLFSPHPPFIADMDKYDYYYNLIEDAPVHPDFEKNIHPAIAEWRRRRNLEGVTKEDWRRVRAAYYANVEFLDDNIGRIVETAKKELGENTIFIYAADHGDSMGINNMVWKTTFFECSVKIPLIFSGPGIQKGRTVEGLTCLNDVTRTLVEYGQGPELPKPYGMSLKDVLEKGQEIDSDRSIISQIGTYGKNKDDIDLPSAMIRKGDYKLVSYQGYDRVSLYNVAEDNLCGNDVGLDSKYDDVKYELLQELNEKWDGEEALRLSFEALDNFFVMQEWANNTSSPIVEKFYDGLKAEMVSNWSMNAKNNYIDKSKVETA